MEPEISLSYSQALNVKCMYLIESMTYNIQRRERGGTEHLCLLTW